jgi:hypothetical protein
MNQRRCWRLVTYHLRDQRAVRFLSRAHDVGQAAMGMVIGLVLLISISAGTLAATAIQHDPLVSEDVVQHLAYRALESGIDTYLVALNQNPNLVNCNSNNTSTTSTSCPSSELPALNSWVTVSGNANNPVTERFMWTNPALCFNAACTAVGSTAGQTLDYVKELIYGAASIGNMVSFQSSYVDLTPENGFLTHLFWSNYESTVPAAGQTQDCTYDWNNNYEGPDINQPGTFNNSTCSAVYFGPNDVLYGPIYTNDSIYVYGGPNFGSTSAPQTVTTHDPHCLFVDPINNLGSPPACSSATSEVGAYNQATSTNNAPIEPIPSTDTALASIAARSGCLYSGPTTITLSNSGTTEYMTVTSPDTPYSSSGFNENDASTNPNNCGTGKVPAPVNGVVFVQNSPSSQTCQAFANPFDGEAPNGTFSQLGLYYGQTGSPDCEGDAFVRGTVSGALTIATQNDIVVDGDITYADCGSSFNSTYANQCSYNSAPGVPNDVLGLIAYAYVEVDRPLATSNGETFVMTSCGASGAQPPPLCDPGAGGLTIDAAILALNDGFGVNNYAFQGNGNFNGNSEGVLDVYGTIAQDYRPAVGTFSGNTLASGYSKYYVWDSRLEYVNVPDYLDPGTPHWSVASTAVSQGVACTATTLLPGYWSPNYNYGSYPQSSGEPYCDTAPNHP